MLGDRLRLARKRSGLSLRGLAARLDGQVTAQALSKYENGHMTPSSTVLIALSKALDVPVGYFMHPMQVGLTGVDFRKTSTAGAKERARVEAEVLQHVERYLIIERVLELDSAAWKNPLPKRKREVDSLDEAEKLATEVRGAWELGVNPIPNMTQLLERHGIKVLLLPLPESVSGLTCMVHRPDEDPVPCIVVNQNHSLERRRLSLAHELFHRVVDPKSAVDIEKAANRFAGAFLVPAEHLRQEIGRVRHAFGYQEMMQLKRIYRISAAALLVRCEQLEIISRGTMVNVFQTVGRGWRREEPDELERPEYRGTVEVPARFERLCHWALSEGVISLSKAVELLQEPVSVIETKTKGPRP